MTETGLIDLARAADFRLGDLEVRPSLREVRARGVSEILEPRVMQVLVALAQARPGIVGRDALIARCWEGRVVGEDAINRAISRLRRLSEGLGRDAFRIETVTKVGYRLIEAGADAPEAAGSSARAPRGWDRRLLIGGGALAAAGLGAGGWWALGRRSPPAAIVDLVARADLALQEGTVEGAEQAAGMTRRAVAAAPDYADAWGLLAVCYAVAAQGRAVRMEGEMRARAEAAAGRAEALDRANPYAAVARTALLPRLGRWRDIERALGGVRRDNRLVLLALADVALSVGRRREAADLTERAMAQGPPSSALWLLAQALWAAGRREDADRVMAEAFSLFPGHFAVWQTRFHLALFSGRPEEALAINADVEGRPAGLAVPTFELNAVVARALATRAAADVEAAVGSVVAAARQGAGYAENAVQYACALGRLDAAFAVARAYFFDEGFEVADLRFSRQQRTYTRAVNRRTRFLFLPSTTPLRADARFADLTARVGLDGYWRETGLRPD